MKRLSEITKKEPLTELTAFQDPPTVLIMRRKAIRLFPNGQRVATYRNDNLDLEVAIPYNPQTLGQHKIATVGTGIGESFENIPADFKVNTLQAAYDRLVKEDPKSDLDSALLNWLESERYEHGDVSDWDKAILDDNFEDYQALIGVNESTLPSDMLFGAYVHALHTSGRPVGHLEQHVATRYGENAARHFRAAGNHYAHGETDEANHHYSKYKHEASLVGEATTNEDPDKQRKTFEKWFKERKDQRKYKEPFPEPNQHEEVIVEAINKGDIGRVDLPGHYLHDRTVTMRNPHHVMTGALEAQHVVDHDKRSYRIPLDAFKKSVKEETIVEATIHSLHMIARSKTPATVRFKNGSNAMVHHGTAARIMRLHSYMRKHNKRKVEALVNSSPDGLKKVVDFVDTHLK